MSSIKNFIKHLYFSARDLMIPKYPSQKLDRSLVILRMDAIGDYILFRNFIEEIRMSSLFKGYHITLIGNTLWKEISIELDRQFIDRFIWIDTKKFHKDFRYRKSALKEIEDTSYSVLFHPTFSRDVYVSELIAKRINADKKIASKGDLSNTTKWQKKQSDLSYSQLISVDKDVLFEFEKNRVITEAFINARTSVNKPSINKKLLTDFKVNDKEYVLLFIGGSTSMKKWDVQNWITLIKHLNINYLYDLIIAGGPDDIEQGQLIIKEFKDDNKLVNLCGKTSIFQLFTLISKSKMMISNETSAPHMAVALDIPVIVIANGSHFGRFTPYPKSYTVEYDVLLPLQIDLTIPLIENASKFSSESTFSINSNKVERVFNLVKNTLD